MSDDPETLHEAGHEANSETSTEAASDTLSEARPQSDWILTRRDLFRASAAGVMAVSVGGKETDRVAMAAILPNLIEPTYTFDADFPSFDFDFVTVDSKFPS